VPDPNQFRDADLVLGQDRGQGVVTAVLFGPVAQRAPRRDVEETLRRYGLAVPTKVVVRPCNTGA